MQQSDDEIKKLLELAKEGHVEGTNNDLNEAQRFVISLGIKEGEEKVSPTEVWLLYLTWAKEPIFRKTFFTQFKKLFHQKKGENWRRYYKLDPSPFSVLGERTWVVNKYIRDERERRKKTNKSKV